MQCIAHVAELWRYPVKGMGGERCPAFEVNPAGIAGDRQLAFESADAPKGKPLLRAAQRAAMLRFRASTAPDGRVLIHTPSRAVVDVTDPTAAEAITRELLALNPSIFPAGPPGDPSVPPLTLIRSPRPLTDVRPVAIHSLQTAHHLASGLDANRFAGFELGFDDRRLRSNIILDLVPDLAPYGHPRTARENALTGRALQIGDRARLRILERIPRCRIASLAPETAEHDPELLRFLAREEDGRAGIYARPLLPGTLRVGDPVYLI